MIGLLMLTAPDSGFFTIVVALVPLLLLLLIVLMAVSMYNGLIKSRLRTTEAWSGITVQLKRRASLIPNLVESVRAYTQHEHEVFTEVTEARGALNKAAVPVATATADQGLTQALGHLMVVAENVSEDIKVSFAKD